jgi:lipopolysaccharide/colanic/teichoic acid biosynthesis glycosyltransferase
MAHYSELDAGLSGPTYVETSGRTPRRVGLYRCYFKRAFDILAVLLAAPFVVPVILIMSLLILRDGGPAFYCQDRVGRGGRVFRIWKLRSMVVDADQKLEAYLASDPLARAEWDEHQKLKNDPRITAVGRLIRKTSLDELPQLFNVLKGDMSLVGPRPPIPDEAVSYQSWHLRRILSVKPGITGLWQVDGRSRVTFDDMVRMDLRYIRHSSLMLDLKIILKTVLVVIRGDGAS